ALPPRRAPPAPADRPRAPFARSLPRRSPAASRAHTRAPSPACDTVTPPPRPSPLRTGAPPPPAPPTHQSARRAAPRRQWIVVVSYGLAQLGRDLSEPGRGHRRNDPPNTNHYPLPLPPRESSRPHRPRGGAAARVPGR